MTTQTLDKGTISQELPKKAYAVERPRVPLVFKLFGSTALLIALVVLVAVGITIQRANSIANQTVDSSIKGAAKLFRELETQRLARVSSPIELLGNDSSFVALIEADFAGGPAAAAAATETVAAPVDPNAPAPAPPPPDLNSLLDQLEQRRASFGSDLTILLDSEGRVIARTDRPAVASATPDDLYEKTPLVKKLIDDGLPATAGVLVLDGKLYHAAVAPVGVGTPRRVIAFLLNAVSIDGDFADRIGESTNAGVVFAAAGSSEAPVRSSNAPSVGMQQMAGVKEVFRTSHALPPSDITIDRSRYVMIAEPLKSDAQTVGAAVFLRSLDRELMPFKQIQQTLLIGGGVALLLAFLISWLIAKRLTRPIEDLAGMAQAVTAGDYSIQPPMDRNDEVGILGRSFAKMITSLRDKAELEELYEQMAAKSEEREAAVVRRTSPAKQEEGTILVTDLRGLPIGDVDAATVIALVARIMRMQETEVARQDGRVREVDGHRLVSVFRGDRGIIHAIRAARAINEELASRTDGSALSVGVGIATGEFVTGTVELSDDNGLALLGNAPLLALLFAWHAPSGSAYISQETAQTAGAEVMASATRDEVRLKWLPQPLAVAALPLVSVTTGFMKSLGAETSTMATLRMGGTQAGATAPGMGAVDLQTGSLFAGRYRIEQILGRGGMGVVYRATDTQLDETVAIKTLPGDVMTRSPEDLERFKREIRLARKITHRNVLRTYDYGEAEGVYFISMEFVRGYTLNELLDEAPNKQMAPRLAVGITRQISRGLQAAHEQGIIHRDIKPQNVLIDAKGEVKLMDFGIARLAEAPEAMTQAGLIVGTPHYMSPEQVQGKQLDARSDVYSMGVLIYEMLAGRKPFESSSLTGILTAHITEKAKPPIEVRPEIGSQINAIVMRCLGKEPAERYDDAGELLADLDRVQAPAVAA